MADAPSLEPSEQQPTEAEGQGGFAVSLENFAGPFEVLLSLITRRQMDITEVSLAAVTDEFIAYIGVLRDAGLERALDEASEFLVVAATLLDLKAARLLPAGEVEDEEDLARLEARDLLFARLLQYKAFKDVAGLLGQRLEQESARHPRRVDLPPELAALLPELVFTTTPEQLAQIAERAFRPREEDPAEVGTDHLHTARVTVRDEAETLAARLMPGAPLSFLQLVSDAEDALVVVVRFLALLEMYRDRVVGFEQPEPLGELTVSWIGTDPGWTAQRLAQDDYQGAPAEAEQEQNTAPEPSPEQNPAPEPAGTGAQEQRKERA